MRKRLATKAALTLSVCLMILWGILGTSSTLTWFADTTPTVRNNLIIPKLDISVSYKNRKNDAYKPIESNKSIFNDGALYEPGYTQVVYLKIENTGDLPFQHKMAVKVDGYVKSTNVYGDDLYLYEHLRFGVMFGDSEAELTREVARVIADRDMTDYGNMLNTYSEPDTEVVEAGDTRYAVLVVYMPEEVGNEANYRGDKVPQVDLGITLYAQQLGAE